MKFVKTKINFFFPFLLLYCLIINLIIISSTSHLIYRIQSVHKNSSPLSASAGMGISYPPEIEHLTVCHGQMINGSQNKIRIYNTGDEDLIISIGFQKVGINFTYYKNNFLLEKGTNQVVDFSINITDPAITGISSIDILGLSGEQAGNPIVTSAKINILFEILETRKITFLVKNNITDEIIPNVKVVLYRLMDTSNYLEYTSQFTYNGSGFFLVAAGIYKLEVYQEDVLIGQKIVAVTSQDVEIVIYCNPIYESLDIIWIFFLIIIISSTTVIFTYLLIQKRKKQKEKDQNKLSQISTIFKDLLNFRHIFIIDKQKGKIMFSQSLSLPEIYPQSISDFLQAIIQFDHQTSSEEEERSRFYELKFGENNILLYEGNFVWVGLITQKRLSIQSRIKLKEFTKEFESKHREIIENWNGELFKLSDIVDLLDKFFDISLNFPYQFQNLFIATIQQNNFDEAVLKSIKEIITKESNKPIFVAKIVNNLLEQFVISENDLGQILLSIKKLISAQILKPIMLR